MTKQDKNTWRFIGFLLLAGIANLCSRTAVPAWDTLMMCINYLTYAGLLLYWIGTVRIRLLPSAARTYTVSAALFMVLYLLIRIFKYRIAVSAASERYAVYGYWLPQMMIPALFLVTCVCVLRGRQGERKWDERLLLIPGAALSLAALTNDLHFLVYIPHIPLEDFRVDTGTYGYGPVFYLFYVWMASAALAGIIMLFRKTGRHAGRAVHMLVFLVFLWFSLVLLTLLVIDRIPSGRRMFSVPEIHIFGMLGVFEICIRSRLIPYNENYTGFFSGLRIPAAVADRSFNIAWHTEAEFSADKDTMKKALAEPVPLTADRKLHGKEIHAGYVFWEEDESAVHRAQAKLREANELIEQENTLIRAETQQKEKDAYLQSRHRIYHEIAEQLYPCQKRIAELLEGAVPGTEDFGQRIRMVSVLNAYVKRKTNLLLLAEEKKLLSMDELFLALQESAAYLTLAGLKTAVVKSGEELYPPDKAAALYDAFEKISEQLLGKASSLMVTVHGEGLRLAAPAETVPDTGGISLPMCLRQKDGILYMDVLLAEGGEIS